MRLFTIMLACLALGAGAADATLFREVAASPGPDGAPSWSPDGSTIAFSSAGLGDWEIILVDAWGGEWTNFTQNPAIDIYANWSAAGGWISFTSRRDNGSGDEDMDIWMQSVDGQTAICLTDYDGYDNFSTIDPSGTRIAFTSDRGGEKEIWVMPLDDPEAAVRISDGSAIECTHATWSPDGEWVAYDGREEGDYAHIFLYRSRADGTLTEKIPTGHLVSCDPGWSPCGRYLAYCGGDDAFAWDLWMWDFEAETVIQLTDTRHAEQSPQWSQDGSEIVYALVRNDNKDIWVAYDLPTPVETIDLGRIKSLFR